jgi:hypothetical protein
LLNISGCYRSRLSLPLCFFPSKKIHCCVESLSFLSTFSLIKSLISITPSFFT